MCCVCQSVRYSFNWIIWHNCITLCECVTWCKNCCIMVAVCKRHCLNNCSLLNSRSDKRMSPTAWLTFTGEVCHGFAFYVKVVSASLQWIILFVLLEVVFQTCILNGLYIVKDKESQSSLWWMERFLHCQLRPFSTVMSFHHCRAPSQHSSGVLQYSSFPSYVLNVPLWKG